MKVLTSGFGESGSSALMAILATRDLAKIVVPSGFVEAPFGILPGTNYSSVYGVRIVWG